MVNNKRGEKVKQYVCGFLFNKNLDRVLLIRKNRPKWQKGYLNGIGGEIESGEPPLITMKREFFEEAGITIDRWEVTCQLDVFDKPESVVVFYAHVFNKEELLLWARAETDEQLEEIGVDELNLKKVIPHLVWLIPLSIDVIKGYISPVTISERLKGCLDDEE